MLDSLVILDAHCSKLTEVYQVVIQPCYNKVIIPVAQKALKGSLTESVSDHLNMIHSLIA